MPKNRDNSSDIILEVLDRMEVRLKKMDDQWNDRYTGLETEVKGHTNWINTFQGKIAVFTSIGVIAINLLVEFIKAKFIKS